MKNRISRLCTNPFTSPLLVETVISRLWLRPLHTVTGGGGREGTFTCSLGGARIPSRAGNLLCKGEGGGLHCPNGHHRNHHSMGTC